MPHQCCHGVDPIVRDLPLITFEAALEHSGRVVLGGFYRCTAVDGTAESEDGGDADAAVVDAVAGQIVAQERTDGDEASVAQSIAKAAESAYC